MAVIKLTLTVLALAGLFVEVVNAALLKPAIEGADISQIVVRHFKDGFSAKIVKILGHLLKFILISFQTGLVEVVSTAALLYGVIKVC